MDATETALYDFLTELLHTRRVSDAAFNNLKTKLGGDKPLIELVGLSAYYTFVSFTLNIDEMAIPPDAEPLPKIPRSKM